MPPTRQTAATINQHLSDYQTFKVLVVGYFGNSLA